jgi:hypothetical protein
MIAQITPYAFDNIGWRFYLVFAVCGFSNALFFWAFLPETRGIPLEELDGYFERVPTAEERENALRAEGAGAPEPREKSTSKEDVEHYA